MKKLLIAMLAVLALVAFTACNSTPAKAEPAKAEPAKVEPAKVEPAKADGIMFEDFEGEFLWVAVGTSWNDGDSSIGAYASEENATQGKQSMEIVFKFNDKNDARFFIEKPEMDDWSGVTAVKMDIFNATDKTIPFYLALQTGDDWLWHATKTIDIAPGKNKDVAFPLNAEIKSAATSWANTGTTIANMQKIVRFNIGAGIQYPNKVDVSGKAFVDNIRLAK
jgi:hypothetical protein